jgi:four helix bundle protein
MEGQSMPSINQGDETEERLIQFGCDAMELTKEFPPGIHATHLARQITKAATSAAPNYAEARVAESRADFIHKMGIALKELNETHVWLRMAAKKFALNPDFLGRLIAENKELCKMFMASIQTAKRNQR